MKVGEAPVAPGNPWTSEVHAVMAHDGLSLSIAEIEQLFGCPPNKAARRVVENAVQRGWFTVSGEHGSRRYTAVPRETTASEQEGFGYGIGKVSSVFDLGVCV